MYYCSHKAIKNIITTVQCVENTSLVNCQLSVVKLWLYKNSQYIYSYYY